MKNKYAIFLVFLFVLNLPFGKSYNMKFIQRGVDTNKLKQYAGNYKIDTGSPINALKCYEENDSLNVNVG